MLRKLFKFFLVGYKTLRRRIFVKLILIIILPNLLLLVIINQLMHNQIRQKMGEMDSTLIVLEHATSRELRAIFNDVTTLTNQILIEPDVQRILSDSIKPTDLGSSQNLSSRINLNYINQESMRTVLSRYRLVWNNIFSIAVIDTKGEIYLNTSENYQITPSDLDHSVLFKEVSSSRQSGLSWSVNDVLSKNTDMITIARKIYGVNSPRKVIGYVIVNLSLDAVRNSFETYNYFGQMIFGLVNNTDSTWMIYDKKKIFGGYGRLLPYSLGDIHTDFARIELSDRSWRTVVRQTERQDVLFVGLDAAYIEKQSIEYRNKLYFGYAFFLMLAVLVSLVGTRVLSKRLGKLNRAMRLFGQKQWGTRIQVKGNDELSIIGHTFNSMVLHIEKLLEDLKDEQRLKRLFELRVLEYQINPHFLYNTLDSINWLAMENNQTEISQMVNGLSKLFRLILSKGKEVISLKEEFEMVSIYLGIQKIRFGDRFEYTLMLDAKVSQYPISKLVLQPLVENSIVHGIRRSRKPGKISLSGKRIDGKIVLEICDNGVGMNNELIKKQKELLDADVLENAMISASGYGIKNVDSRLKLLYDIDYSMTMESSTVEPSGTVVRICIKEKAMQTKLAESLV